MDDWFRIIAVVAVTVAVAAGSGVIWLARWTGKHEGWRDAWTKGMEEFKSETRAALGGIREDIKKILVAMPKDVLARTSPVRLTDFGKEVSESVGAAAWAEEKAPELVDEIKGKSAYEVQEFCMDHMRGEDSLSPEEDRKAKDCAYEHGIKLEQVHDVFAVELRDRLLCLARDAP